jgi:hypothetical protein
VTLVARSSDEATAPSGTRVSGVKASGSLVIYIQNESPGSDKEANWLPAPTGRFHLMLRLYWPDENKPSIIDGSWTIPGVVKV